RRAAGGRSVERPPDAGRELGAVIDEELARLPERFRAPLLLCYLEGRTRDEAAGQLGCALGTLKHRLERGRELLRGRLARRRLTLAAALLAAELTQHAAAAVPGGLVAPTARAAGAFAGGGAGRRAAPPARAGPGGGAAGRR